MEVRRVSHDREGYYQLRDREIGDPMPDPALFTRFLPIIEQSTNAVVSITTGGGLTITGDGRLAASTRPKPEICCLNIEFGKEHGACFEFDCYDVGYLYELACCLARGVVERPLFVETIFGIFGGIGAEPRNLLDMKEIADPLFGDAHGWPVLAAGRHQIAITIVAGAGLGAPTRSRFIKSAASSKN